MNIYIKVLDSFFLCLWVFSLRVCKCTTCVPGTCGGQKKESELLEVELYLWAFTWVQGFCTSSQGSCLVFIISAPPWLSGNSLWRPGWLWTRRSACLGLPNAEINGTCHCCLPWVLVSDPQTPTKVSRVPQTHFQLWSPAGGAVFGGGRNVRGCGLATGSL